MAKQKSHPGTVAQNRGASCSYPGGKSGEGVYQRLINEIPPHRVFVSAFAGHCGVTRRIRPSEHTIVIDADPEVCQWWDDWRRSSDGRQVEIHCCDSMQWMEFRFGLFEFGKAARVSPDSAAMPAVPTHDASEAFLFCDPPYLLGLRSSGRQYREELSDGDHARLLRILTRIPASKAPIMLCGYRSKLYQSELNRWRSVKHQVPTRGGPQTEYYWTNYQSPEVLHDYRYLGKHRRDRERIRRRQINWRRRLERMNQLERAAMLTQLRQIVTFGSKCEDKSI